MNTPVPPLITRDSNNSSNKSLTSLVNILNLPTYSSTSDIINPVPGMLVYLSSINNLGVYNGTTWEIPTSGEYIQQGSKLVGTGYVSSDIQQGYSVALSSDGDTLAIGGYADDNYIGATWIFTRSAGIWTQQGSKLIGTGYAGTSPSQGTSVALSSDGNTLAVGGNNDDDGIGATWIFVRSAGIWTQQGSKLVGTGYVGSFIQQGGGDQGNGGQSVALSSDGNTLAVGGNYDDNGIGATWIFVRSAGIWTQQGSKLIGTGYVGTDIRQGWSVSLSGNGDTMAIGGINDNMNIGAVWVFTRTAGVWTQQGSKLVGTGYIEIFPNQGQSVSLSEDGDTLAVGGPYDDGDIGATWIFTRTAGVWTQQGSKLVGTGASGIATARQGWSTALSSDGNTMAIGGPDDHNGIGATWVFTRTAGVWTQQGSTLIGTGYIGANIRQGTSVALSADGNTLAIGGNSDNAIVGATWIFIRTAGVWSQQGPKLVGTSGGQSEQGASVSLSSDGNTLAIGGPGNGSVGSTWIFIRSAGVWSEEAQLEGTGASGNARQGTSVELDSNGDTVAIGGRADNGNIGATWIFVRSVGVWTQQGSKLVGTGYTGTSFQGTSVALSSDGNTLAVGGTRDNSFVGATWVFTRSGITWTQQGSKLVGTGAISASEQGSSVALSGDGNTLATSGSSDNNYIGAIWIFTRTAGVWSQQGSKLVGTGATGQSQQGYSIALSGDGDTLAVGGNEDDNGTGAEWVFTRSVGVWSQQGSKIIGTGGFIVYYIGQGFSVSLSADGNTLAVGGYYADFEIGTTWIFKRSGGIWTQFTKLTGTGYIGPYVGQGVSVSLSANGNTLAIGGPYDNNNIGATWIFKA